VLAALSALPCPAAAAPSMTVSAEFEPQQRNFTGSFRVTWHNTSPTELHELKLFRYPEMYRNDPDLDDILLERVYPRAFDAGGQQVSALRYRVSDGPWREPTDVRTADGQVPILVIALHEPVGSGLQVELAGEFSTEVPRRYGTFGMHAGVITLNGGLAPLPVSLDESGRWLDHAPPPAMERNLQLDLPSGWQVTLGGTIVALPGTSTGRAGPIPPGKDWDLVAQARTADSVEVSSLPDGRMRCLYHQPAGRWFTASLRQRARMHNLPLADGNSVSFVGKRQGTRQRRWLRRAVETSRALLQELGIETSEHGVTLVQAPLRRRLVESGDGVVLVSDRLLEAAEPLWRYHDVHLAQAVLAQQIATAVDDREAPLFAPLVTEGMAWQLIPEYLRRRWKQHVNVRDLLSKVDFIPEVDALLTTPLFPFAEQVFDNPRVVDSLRADIRRFNRPLRSGRLLFFALADRVGARSLDAGVTAYLGGNSATTEPLHQLLKQRTGRSTVELFEGHLREAPRVNYVAEALQRSRDPEGRNVTIVTVRRELLEGEAPNEQVEVRLRSRRPGRKRWSLLRWDGKGESHSWRIVTDDPIAAVEVDPFGRHTETDADGLSLRHDNRRPAAMKVMGSAYLVSLNTTSFELEAYGRLEFRRKHDHRNQLNIYAYTDKETWLGVQTGYVHSFGRPRVGNHRRHRISAHVGVDLLNSRFRPTDAPLLLQAGLSYIFESRVWALAPTRGGRLQLSLFAGKDLHRERDWERSFAESTYFGVSALAIRLIRLHPWHVLALRAKVGWVTGNVIHRNFTLGGNHDLRGIPEDFIVDPFRALGTVEWRHHYFRDQDIQLPLSRLRAIQGVLFAEYGVVGVDFHRGAPWWREHWASRLSLGYGLRLFVDWFGLLPGMLGVDVAWTPGAPLGRLPLPTATEHWPEVPLQVYLLAGQSF